MRTGTAPVYGRLVRLHAPLLGATAAATLLFEVFMVWMAAQLEQGAGLQGFLEMVLPPEMQRVVFQQFGVGSFQGIVAFGFQHPIFLVAVVAFIVVAGTVPAAERETGFMDLVLARPLPRRAYLLGVVLLVLTGALVLPAAILAGAALGLATVDAVPVQLSWTAFAPAAFTLGLLLLAVGGIAVLSAVGARRRGPAVGRAVGLILPLYWLDFVGPLWDVLETARWISPFTYFDPTGVVGGAPALRDVAVLLGVFVATTAAAFWEFGRQDV